MNKEQIDELGNKAILGIMNAWLEATQDELNKKLTDEDKEILCEFIRGLVEITTLISNATKGDE